MNVRNQALAYGAGTLCDASVSTFVFAQGSAAPVHPQRGQLRHREGLGRAAREAADPGVAGPAGTGSAATELHLLYRALPVFVSLHKAARGIPTSRPKWGVSGRRPAHLAGLFVKGGAWDGRRDHPGVLAPAYEAAFKMRRSWARTTTGSGGRAAGYPRWLLEPYVRECQHTSQSCGRTTSATTCVVCTSTRSTRTSTARTRRGGQHRLLGDDMLIVHTVAIYPKRLLQGQRRRAISSRASRCGGWFDCQGRAKLRVNVTFYDKLSLVAAADRHYHVPAEHGTRESGYGCATGSARATRTVPGDDDKGRPARSSVCLASRFRRRARRRPEAEPGPSTRASGTREESDLRGSPESEVGSRSWR